MFIKKYQGACSLLNWIYLFLRITCIFIYSIHFYPLSNSMKIGIIKKVEYYLVTLYLPDFDYRLAEAPYLFNIKNKFPNLWKRITSLKPNLACSINNVSYRLSSWSFHKRHFWPLLLVQSSSTLSWVRVLSAGSILFKNAFII